MALVSRTAVAAVALAAASCTGNTAATTTTPSAAPSAAPTATTAAPTTTSTTSTTVASTTTSTTTEVVPTGPPPGSMLIANQDGVFVATLEGVVSQMVRTSPDATDGLFAVDDTRGGIIFQPNRLQYFFRGTDSIVYWIPQGAGGYQQLLVPAADQSLVLEDVVPHDESVMVYYTRASGDTIETAEETLRRFDLDAKTVSELGVVGGWESGVTSVSVGGEALLLNGFAEGWVWTNWTDLDFEPIEPPTGPAFEENCLPECFFYGELSPDGTRIAYGRQVFDDDRDFTGNEVEVHTVATGALLMRVALPGHGYFESLDLSDDYVLVNLVDESLEFLPPIVIDIASGGTATYQAPVSGTARFLRSVPDLDGVINWP